MVGYAVAFPIKEYDCSVKLDSPAFVENDRTYTPIRFISENLGATVEWNETEQTVTIQRVK